MPQLFNPWSLMKAALAHGLGGNPEAVAPDPLDHPVFRGISARELADIPWPRPLTGQDRQDGLGPQREPPEIHACCPAA